MKNVLKVLSGGAVRPAPIWLMRQAGRYLPEYREIRAQAGSFLNLVYDPKRAAEVTVQPLRRYGMDAAILFSDILVVPHAMGVEVTFTPGDGPSLVPVLERTAVDCLIVDQSQKYFLSVYETVKETKRLLETEKFDQTTFLGFAGGPWTIACYMVQGNGKNHEFESVRSRAQHDAVFFDALIARITEATIGYLKGQIEAGVDGVQIFDSWAGVADGALFDRYVIAPTQKIVNALRAEYPHIPIIGFPRGAGHCLIPYARETGVDAIGADTETDLKRTLDQANNKFAVQGNLDPQILLAGGVALDNAVRSILEVTQNTRHIFNLGHGILPETPPAHVDQLIRLVREA